MSDTTLRARRATEIVDAAFALYRRHPMPFILITALANLPSLLISITTGQFGNPVPQGGAFWVNMLLSMFTMQVATGVINRAGSTLYLENRLDIAEAVRLTVTRLPSLLGGFILMMIGIFFGIILLIIPGVYLVLRWYVATSAIMLEGKGAFGALGRSSALTDGRKWHVFATVALSIGIYMLLFFGLGIAGGLTGSTFVAEIIATVAGVIVYPFIGLTNMILYYDLRIRNEGFDVEYMAQSLGDSPSAATSPAY